MAEGDEKSEIGKIDLAQAAPPDRTEGVRKSYHLERKEVLCNMEVNWDDEYVLEFARAYQEVMKQHMGEVNKVACMDKSTVSYVVAKAELFGNIIGNLQWRIKAEHITQQVIVSSLKSFSGTAAEREKISAQLIESRYKVRDFETFKGNLILLKSAYEKFASDRMEVERHLLSGIEKGEIQVPDSMPYVMFVNKATDKQYSVVYKYDKKAKRLSFKTCNIVSTGDQIRWLQEEPEGGHVTPAKVFYIGATKGLKHSSLKDKGDVYGGEFVEKDHEPYQMFRLYTKNGDSYEYTGYLIHPTWEEPLLGQTASHGCIRVPRLMDLQLVRIYDEWYKEQGITDFKKMPPDKETTPSVKMPVVVRGI